MRGVYQGASGLTSAAVCLPGWERGRLHRRQRGATLTRHPLPAALSQQGHAPTSIHTKATVDFGPVAGGFAISRITLETEGQVPGIDAAAFEQVAQAAKAECPVSKALAAVEINLVAKLR